MTWGSILLTCYVVITASIGALATIAAHWFHQHRFTNGISVLAVRIAIVLYAIAVDAALSLIANAFDYFGPRPQYSIGFSLSFWSGRIILASALVALINFQATVGKHKPA